MTFKDEKYDCTESTDCEFTPIESPKITTAEEETDEERRILTSITSASETLKLIIAGTGFGTDVNSNIYLLNKEFHNSEYKYTGTISSITDEEIKASFIGVSAGSY